MKLSELSLVLGLGTAAAHAWALFRGPATAQWLRKFPRNVPLGVVLMLLGTVWFEWNLAAENLEDIARYKKLLQVFFAVLGVACCFFAQDFLAVRGLSVVLLMAALVMCDTARWHPSLWRDAITGWAYVWVLAALWLSVQPWRLRDWIGWLTADTGRFKLAAVAGIVWGLFIAALGLTVLR